MNIFLHLHSCDTLVSAGVVLMDTVLQAVNNHNLDPLMSLSRIQSSDAFFFFIQKATFFYLIWVHPWKSQLKFESEVSCLIKCGRSIKPKRVGRRYHRKKLVWKPLTALECNFLSVYYITSTTEPFQPLWDLGAGSQRSARCHCAVNRCSCIWGVWKWVWCMLYAFISGKVTFTNKRLIN